MVVSMMKMKAHASAPRPNSLGKREMIAEAALRVMIAEGVYRTTTRRIAEAAGVNVATLHYHFHDKEEILLSVMERLVTSYGALLSARFAAPQPLSERVADLLWFIWSEIEKAPGEQLVLQEMTLYVLRHPEAEHMAAEKDRVFLSLYATALQSASDVGPEVHEKVSRLANFVYTSFVGILNQWLATHDTALLRTTTETLIDAARAIATKPAPCMSPPDIVDTPWTS
jgi:AcrR family transcriptional regulator